MKKVLIALCLLLVLLVSCKTVEKEVVVEYIPLDLSEPNQIMFDSRPQQDWLIGDVTTYEGLMAFNQETLAAYREWRGYAINLEIYLKAIEDELKKEE